MAYHHRLTTCPLQTRTLSSTASRLADPANGNPEPLPRFSLKQLGATPRARAVVYLGIFVLALAEGAAYYKFTPKVFGWGEKDAERK